MITQLPIQIYGPRTQRLTPATVRVESWDRRGRAKRALKMLGMCWGAAIVLVPFPILHLTLVPLLLLTGPFAAAYVFSRDRVILDGAGDCPDCGKPFRVARLAYRFPQSDLCEHCQSSVKLELP